MTGSNERTHTQRTRGCELPWVLLLALLVLASGRAGPSLRGPKLSVVCPRLDPATGIPDSVDGPRDAFGRVAHWYPHPGFPCSPVATTIRVEDGIARDEWGRHFGNVAKSPFGSLGDWLTAASALSVFIPGYGPAVSAALAGLASVGRGESLGNAVLASARGAVGAQFGPAATVGFDAAVGAAGYDAPRGDLELLREKVKSELGPAGEAGFDAALQA